MVTKVIFVGRATAETTPGWQDWAVVSITEPGFPGEAKLMPGWHAIHRVTFDDADPAEDDPGLHIMITDEDAHDIVCFVYAHSNLEGFMVHCNKGIGRSQGVAAWLSEHFDIPEYALTDNGSEFALHPLFNQHVYQILKRHDSLKGHPDDNTIS